MSVFARAYGGAATLVLAIALALLTACGGGGGGGDGGGNAAACPSPSAGSGTLSATEKDFSIELGSTDLTAGRYEITVCNEGPSTHTLAVEKDGDTLKTSDSISAGDTTTLSVDLETGDYVFYCSIGTHRAMGMEVDVTVS